MVAVLTAPSSQIDTTHRGDPTGSCPSERSVKGPRPPLPEEVEKYEEMVYRRLLVKPGITGLWQVSGRSDLSWEESVRLDLYYVENWSLTTDFVILARTVRAVFAKDGAY